MHIDPFFLSKDEVDIVTTSERSSNPFFHNRLQSEFTRFRFPIQCHDGNINMIMPGVENVMITTYFIRYHSEDVVECTGEHIVAGYVALEDSVVQFGMRKFPIAAGTLVVTDVPFYIYGYGHFTAVNPVKE